MKRIAVIAFLISSILSYGQLDDKINTVMLDYENPQKFEIGDISVSGNNFTDKNIIILMSGLSLGQTITVPGDETRVAIDRMWKQHLFSDIEVGIAKMVGTKMHLNIVVKERPRLSKYSIKGLRKGETNNVRDEISLKKNQLITEDLLNTTQREIKEYFFEKGYYGVKTTFNKSVDPEKPNFEILRIEIKRGKKIKVQDIVFEGNENIEDKKLRKLLKPKRMYKKWNIFASSKYVEDVYDETRPAILQKYSTMGYRDVSLLYDSVQIISENRVNIKIGISEGKKYYFRNITWTGNTKYRASLLDTLLGIKKGEIYDQSRLESKLFMSENGFDVSSLYMDDGYLFFNINPVEVLVENDSIDLEMRIYEGKQATVNRITIVGNDKTSDFVALRVIRTRPGDKFSRSDIQRSMRELAQLGFFDPEGLDVNPVPNPQNGTVDIEYKVVEKPSDQIEASGGWGGFGGFVGTLGLTLNNFSSRKMFQKGGWDPIPAGDGQKLAIRAQSNGPQFQGYNFSFTEPWLGGKKPNSFSISLFHNVQSTFQFTKDRPKFTTTGGSVSFGKQLKFPDDYFSFSTSITYQRYGLQDWSNFGAAELGFSNGNANNLSIMTTLGRNSSNHPIYPTEGSKFNASVQFTPPYSAFSKDKDYASLSAQEKFKWVELVKTKFSGQWFLGFPNNVKRQFVLTPSYNFGAVSPWNKDLGYSPFELFRVGGSGLSNFVLYGTDVVSQRGYDEGKISDPLNGQSTLPIYTKYSLELRYPLTVGQSSTIYAQTFLEAGNAYQSFQDFNPFRVRRAAGVGVRLFLPMFGLLGVDYAWAMDPGQYDQTGQFHFFIGQQF
ncbi:outer membrane protein assembly factor BamA [Bacteroidia bacterium]|nr:outer membrane protein assembly factor BamA [Bacteroidia bacterium]MDB4107011.1 outer membrane protein assembly factor BamA [Bacteroidia bacterium]MDB9882470.1 outer membrane protein assembly factor BamA [Bacteroidia bacterium]